MQLPFLPTLKKIGEATKKLGGVAKRIATPSIFSVIPGFPEPEFLSKISKGVSNFAVSMARDIPRSMMQLGIKATQKLAPELEVTQFTPENKLERFIYGKEPVVTPEEWGREFLTEFGISEDKASKFGKAIGIPLAIMGALPPVIGPKKVIVKKVAAVPKAIDKFIDAIKAAKPARKAIEQLTTAERGRRAVAGAKVLAKGKGEKAFFQALGTLKGKLPKIEFEPIRGGVKFVQKEVDELFDIARKAPGLDFYEKITTQTGLTKILDGAIPTEGELRFLGEVFGPELPKAVMSKISFWKQLGPWTADIINVPRSLMASIDMSAPFRQGIVLVTGYPKRALKAFGGMFQYFGSDRIFRAAQSEILDRPTFKLMKDSGLYLANLTSKTARLAEREERFMSRFAERIPVVGRLVKAGERAYIGFLNQIRADVFDDIAREYVKSGVDFFDDPKLFKDVARFVNVMTGRGAYSLERFGTVLNTVFFSPRLIASRFQALNPVFYAKLHPVARKEAMKSMVKFVSTGVGVLALAKIGGADVESDPRSADFGKIKVGNVRWDVWGGFQQWVRFISQLITGEYISTTTGELKELKGKEFPFLTRSDAILSFTTGKFAPVPALVNDLLRNRMFSGEEPTVTKEMYNKTMPLYIQDVIEAINEMGLNAIPTVGIPVFFGVGVQAYGAKAKGLLPSSKSLPALPRLPSLPKLGK